MDATINDNQDPTYTQVAATTTTTTEVAATGRPAHHMPDGTFTNPWPSWKMATFVSTLQLGATSLSKRPKLLSKEEFDRVLPVVEPNWEQINNPDPNVVQTTWIGHATFLVQVDGFNILTDPVFSERCSFVQWLGPKRYRPVPCTIAQLPKVDIVVLSHNHYDHLDHGSTMELFRHHDPWFYVPLGMKKWYESCGITKVYELDWWQSMNHTKLKQTVLSAETNNNNNNNNNNISNNNEEASIDITFLPVQHWSYRNGRDRFHSLWGGWGIHGKKSNKKVFFAGDTGYCPVFKQIGARYGPIDVALIPIGAYEPRWFMKPQHVDPEEAVQISLDIRAKVSIGMHWGTFILTIEPLTEPREKLEAELKRLGLPPDHFITLKHGETRGFD